MDILYLSDQFARSNTSNRRLADSEQNETTCLLSPSNLFSSDPNRSMPSCPTSITILDCLSSDRFSSNSSESLSVDTAVCHRTATGIDHVCHRSDHGWKYVVHEFILLQLSANALQIRGLRVFIDIHVAQVKKEVRWIFTAKLVSIFRIWISELERSRITVEEVKPLLHDEVRFQNDNCTILFPNDVDDDDEDTDISFVVSSQQNSQSPTHPTAGDAHQSKPIIRTKEMSPGEIFTSIMDKFDAQSTRCLWSKH